MKVKKTLFVWGISFFDFLHEIQNSSELKMLRNQLQ